MTLLSRKSRLQDHFCATVHLSDASSLLFIAAQMVGISHGKGGARHLCCKIKSTEMEFGGPEF